MDTNNKKDLCIEKQIIEIIEEIRPFLNMDGGDISFIKFEDGCVYVKLLGACSHCMAQDETLNEGILMMIREKIPQVNNIVNVLL